VEKHQALMLLQRALDDSKAMLRPGQWEAIDALVNHRRKLLVVERTGWGKSLIYFISTRALRDRGQGPTLIVSPLLALMRNQQTAAERLGIRAISINSSNRNEWPALQAEILRNQADALLISPERLANDRFVEELLLPVANRIGLMVVDEAHCISDWGHDFRPDYRRLVNILKLMPPNMPVLGTTATANNWVLDDVKNQLGGFVIQRGPLVRESLHLQTLRLADQAERLAWLAKYVPKFSTTGIIYTPTKKDAEQALRAEAGRVLSRWSDAGWGRLAADDKHTGRFRDELVDAAAEMILDRWRPEPFPGWVICVPSLRHPELVPDFSKRLAARLGLTFKDVVSKLKDNEPQKLQNNSWHQCRNLDGAFGIKKGVAETPVLLVDDMVDSRWTVTVIAALLRQAGSGPVFPVALATTFTNG